MKIIQITAMPRTPDRSQPSLIGLCDDGSVWETWVIMVRDEDGGDERPEWSEWQRIPGIGEIITGDDDDDT